MTKILEQSKNEFNRQIDSPKAEDKAISSELQNVLSVTDSCADQFNNFLFVDMSIG